MDIASALLGQRRSITQHLERAKSSIFRLGISSASGAGGFAVVPAPHGHAFPSPRGRAEEAGVSELRTVAFFLVVFWEGDAHIDVATPAAHSARDATTQHLVAAATQADSRRSRATAASPPCNQSATLADLDVRSRM